MPLVENENGYRTGIINVNGNTYEIKPNAYLRYANLKNANLIEADLSGANLSGANLRRADLRGAHLFGSDLHDSDLRGTYLFGADLSGTFLYNADLSGTDLSGTFLYNANLQGAELQGADLSNAQMTHQDWQDIRDSSINVHLAIGIPDSRLPEQVQSRPVPKGIQELYENDKCPVCLEDYNGKEKCVMTNCGHLTCMECMQGMVDSDMKLDCPTCRKSFAFGSSFGVVISKRNNRFP
jgi:hypothetical protein